MHGTLSMWKIDPLLKLQFSGVFKIMRNVSLNKLKDQYICGRVLALYTAIL